MSIRREALVGFGFFYLFMPVLIFLLGWVRPFWSVPLVVISLVALYRARHTGRNVATFPDFGLEGLEIDLPFVVLVAVCTVILAWVLLCGQGGLVVQTGDWRARNAIFRDLLTHSWPVMYPKVSGSLSYYVGHWLPAACCGRGVYLLTGSMCWAWRIGNALLLLWTYLGILDVVLLLIVSLRVTRKRQIFGLLAAFIFFGGLDCIGYLSLWLLEVVKGGNVSCSGFSHLLDHWCILKGLKGQRCIFEFSSLTTQLSYVFNQCVPAWVATMLLLVDRNVRTVGCILCPLLICGVFPFAGLCLLFAGVFVYCVSVRKMRISDVLSDVNCLAAIGMLVVPLIYLLTNSGRGMFALFYGWTLQIGLGYLFFLCMEIGILFVLLPKECRRNSWVLTALVLLAVCPVLRLGNGRDFGMRASIPPLIVFMLVMCKALCCVSGRRLILTCWLFCAGIGPLFFLSATVHKTATLWDKCSVSKVTWRWWPDFHRLTDNETYDKPINKLRKIRKYDVYFCMKPKDMLFYRFFSK